MLVFYWNDDGGFEKWVKVDGEFFISRLDEDFVRLVDNPRSIGVYMYWFRDGSIVDMGVDSSWVSRKHLLVSKRDDGVYIRDHGVEGKGSTNGTYLNGKKIDPSREYVVKPGDNIKVGGDLTILVGVLASGNKPLLLINPGRTFLPESIVEAGVGKGVERIRKVVVEGRERPIVESNVSFKPVDYETPAGARVVNDRFIKSLLWGSIELYTAIVLINKGRIEDAYRRVRNIVKNNSFREAVRKRCSSARDRLEELERALVIEIRDKRLTRFIEDLVEAIRTDLELESF